MGKCQWKLPLSAGIPGKQNNNYPQFHRAFAQPPVRAWANMLAQMKRMEFERDLAIRSRVLRQADLSHPTGADLLDDPAVTDMHSRG